MANVELNIGISAEYDLLLQKVVTDAAGKPVLDGDGKVIPLGAPRKVHSQKNVITDNGMNFFGNSNNFATSSGGFGTYCRVGGGSTEPAFTDTALVSQIASVSGGASNWALAWGTGDDLNAVIASKTFTFGVGAAAGNLTEIGLGNSASDNLHTRSLFKDPGGSPVTINVASDEQLIVNYRLIFRCDTTDKVFNPAPTSPTPTSYTLTLRPAYLGIGTITGGRLGAGTNDTNQRLYYGPTADIGPVTGGPTGTSSNYFTASVGFGTYVPGSFERTDTYTIGTATANHADIGAFVFVGSSPFEWQLGISPRLTKVAPETIKITILNKWNRA